MAVYVVDSNFFIEAHRVTYPLDIAKGFWNKVQQLAHAETIISIDKVKKELYQKNDDLESWCRENLPLDFFKNSDEIMEEYARVAAWAISMRHHYLPNALNEFLDADEADAFLIAYVLVDPTKRILVTQEIRAPQKKNKIKIPDCCDAFDVPYMNTIKMFRNLGETF